MSVANWLYLATNLGGNIDQARLLVKELGISFEDLTQAIIDSGLKSGQSWLWITSQLNSFSN